MSRGVYLFDEFDAIGSKRTADNDVGEMRRVLNSFLQFMEEENSTDSVIAAATNYRSFWMRRCSEDSTISSNTIYRMP